MTTARPGNADGGPVLAVVADLIFASKIEATARLAGVTVLVVRGTEAALRNWADVRGAAVDLNIATDDALDLVRRMKTARPEAPVVAYLAHVQVELAAQARAAGADVVLPRSRFTADLGTLLHDLSVGRIAPAPPPRSRTRHD